MPKSVSSRALTALLLASTALVCASSAFAQTWDGSDSNSFTDGTNWVGGTPPGGTSTATIDTATPNAARITFGDNIAIGAVDVGGAGTLTIVGGGILVTSNSANIGTEAGDTAALVTVSGGTSQWTSGSTAATLLIGRSDGAGIGRLEVLNGGLVDFNAAMTLGAGSSVRVSGVDGTPARLTVNSANLAGTVTIENGGAFETEILGLANGGSLTVQSGGQLTKTSTGTFIVGQTAQVRISGAGTVVNSNGGVGLTNSAVGTPTADFIVENGAVLNFTGAVGPGVAFSNGATGENRSLIVQQGGRINGGSLGGQNGSVVLETGGQYITTGSWNIIGNSALSISSGGRMDLGTAIHSFSAQTSALITGAGSQLNVAGTLNLQASTSDTGINDFEITDGAVVTVSGAGQSSLSFGGERKLGVTNAALNMTGGLLMNRGTLEATNATLNFGAGSVTMGNFGGFSGNTLSLFNTDITAAQISTGGTNSGVDNAINLGGSASGPAGTVGAFNVGTVSLDGSSVGAEFVLNHTATDFDIASTFSSIGGTIRHVAGDTIFSGNSSTYNGQTILTGGTLSVNGSLGNALHVLDVSSGATLGGSGSIGGTVNVTDGRIAPGNSPGTLTIVGDLFLGSASVLDFELGNPGGTAGVDSDLINLSGDLILDGTLNVIDAGGFGAGLYRLISFGGNITDNGLDIGTAPTGFDASNLTVQITDTSDGDVNLLVGAPVAATSGFMWDGANITANGAVDGGAGTWTETGTNWTIANGSANAAYDENQLLIFTGTSGIVHVDDSLGSVELNSGVQFAVNGYSVTGDDLRLDSAIAFRVGDGTAAGAGFTATVDSNLTGTGSLEKTDLGTLILNGANTYAGDTGVTNGRLIVNGSLVGPINIVRSGATLGGTGSLAGMTTIDSGGTIAPGNSIGTLNVANITMAAGSTYTVELNDGGFAAGTNNDLINATGTTTINGGTVHVTSVNGTDTGTTYTPGTYTILTATGGVTGTFGGVTDDYAFLDFTDSYDANNVFITSALASPANPCGTLVLTFNQTATCGGVLSIGSGSLHTAVLNLFTAEAPAALDQLSGEAHASSKTALIEDSRFAREAALARLRVALGGADRNVGQTLEETPDGTTIWAQGFGSWSQWGGDGNAATLNRSIGGLFMGADAQITDDVTIGLLGGHSRSGISVSDRMSSGTVDSYTLGAYAGGNWDGFSLKGGTAYSWNTVNMYRSVAFTGFSDALSASYNAGTFQAYAEAAYGIDVGHGRIEPFASLAHVNLNSDGYAETGGAAALTAAGQVVSATFTTLGIRGETEIDLGSMDATVSGGIGWQHAFADTPTATHAFAGGTAFTVAGVSLAQDTLVLDAGLDLNLSDTASFAMSYNGQFGSGIQDHTAKAKLAVRF